MEDIQDRLRQKKKIEKMFRSEDPILWKLGKSLCHALRINYYIVILKIQSYPDKKKSSIIMGYYTERPVPLKILGTIYEIRLEKYK